MLVFEERGKYREPGEKPPEKSEHHNKLNPQFAPSWNTDWLEASALTTAPSVLPGICKIDPQGIHIRGIISSRDNYSSQK